MVPINRRRRPAGPDGRRRCRGGQGRAPGQPRSHRQRRHEPRPQAREAVHGRRSTRGSSRRSSAGRRTLAGEYARGVGPCRAARVHQPAAVGRPAGRDGRRRPRGRCRVGPRLRDPPRVVNVEFVSANPTGPLTIGNARGAFVGDLLCRVLAAGGQQVTREYYFNDSGGQIDRLGASISPRSGASRSPMTAITEPTSPILRRPCRPTSGPQPRRRRRRGPDPRALGRRTVRAGIEASLERLGVHFDVWKSEGSLHADGWVGRAIEQAPRARPPVRAGRGDLVPLDGVRRRQGPGRDPIERRADLLRRRHRLPGREVQSPTTSSTSGGSTITATSPGHARRPASASIPSGQVLLTGWVSVIRDGPGRRDVQAGRRHLPARHAPRDIGVDAARWFFASRGANLDMDIDVDLARRQTSENPVYYVQYAHARIASILRKAADVGLTPAIRRGHLAVRRRPLSGRSSGSRGRRGRGHVRGDARRHRLRHRARHAVPRVLSRRAGGRRGRAGAVGGAPRPVSRRRGRRSRTRSGCSGSAPPTRCSPVGGPARPRMLAAFASVWSSVR